MRDRAADRRAIVLVGPMASGKTTVARRLAVATGRPAVDADAEIERGAGASVAEIFATEGEEAFRRSEAEVIVALLDLPGPHEAPTGPAPVISLGGGAVTSAAVRAALVSHAVVWLRARPETSLARLGADGLAARPLLIGDPLDVLTRVRDERDPYHRQVATLVVDVDDRTPEEVVAEVLAALAAGGTSSGGADG